MRSSFEKGGAPSPEGALKKEEMKKERLERFPEVDAAVRAFESAEQAKQTLLKALDELPDARSEAFDQLQDWVTNLIPGVEKTKRLMDWMRITFGGSLRYAKAPYASTDFDSLKASIAEWAELEKTAVELGVGDLFHSLDKQMSAAEVALGEALEQMGPDEQLELFELQQKIFQE